MYRINRRRIFIILKKIHKRIDYVFYLILKIMLDLQYMDFSHKQHIRFNQKSIKVQLICLRFQTAIYGDIIIIHKNKLYLSLYRIMYNYRDFYGQIKIY